MFKNRMQIKSVNLDKLFLQRTQRTPTYSQLSWRPLRPALNLRRAATVRNTGLKRNTTREIISVCICMYTYIRRLSLLLVKTVCPAKYFCNRAFTVFPPNSEQCCNLLKQSVTISHFPAVWSNLKQTNLQTWTQGWHQVLRKILGRMATTRSFSFEYEIMIPTSQLLIIRF